MKPTTRGANVEYLDTSMRAGRAHRVREIDQPLPSDELGDFLKAKIGGLIDSLFVPSCVSGDTLINPDKRSALRRIAKKLHEVRRRRARFLTKELFGEPGWDILLGLYAIEVPMSVKSVCSSAGVPYTTAWRWIAILEDNGFIDREDDTADGRRVRLCLTAQGEKHVEAALNDIVANLSEVSDLLGCALRG